MSLQVSVSKARAIIVLASDENADQVSISPTHLHYFDLTSNTIICSHLFFSTLSTRVMQELCASY